MFFLLQIHLQKEENEEGMWEESFKTHHDSKPYGKLSRLSVNTIINLHHSIRSVINWNGYKFSQFRKCLWHTGARRCVFIKINTV